MLDGERPARADHLAQRELVAEDGEHRDRVAARVDRVEQAVGGVVGERALRGEMVDDRAGQLPAEAAGVVGAGLGQGAVVGARCRRRSGCRRCCRSGRTRPCRCLQPAPSWLRPERLLWRALRCRSVSIPSLLKLLDLWGGPATVSPPGAPRVTSSRSPQRRRRRQLRSRAAADRLGHRRAGRRRTARARRRASGAWPRAASPARAAPAAGRAAAGRACPRRSSPACCAAARARSKR